MNFTNTDDVGEDIYWYFDGHGHGQVNCQVNWKVWKQVDDQLNWKVYDHHKSIEIKIKQETYK